MIRVKLLCSSTIAHGTVNDEVNTVTIKVPPLFKHAPESWCIYFEAQFDLKQLKTSSTKFYYCISDLPSDIAAQLTHMIRDPGEDPYQEIKDCIIHLYMEKAGIIHRSNSGWSSPLQKDGG